MAETEELAKLRRLLLLALAAGMSGLVLELVLLEHFESRTQWVPLVALAVALPLTLGVLARPTRLLLRAHQAVMAALIAIALLGIWFHYDGNVEFELEMKPSLSGWALVKEALHGATPSLSPGSLAWIGVIGLLATFRRGQRRGDPGA